MVGTISTLSLMLALALGTLYRPAVAFSAVLCMYGLKQWGQSATVIFATHRTAMNFFIASLVAISLAKNWRMLVKNTVTPPAWILSVLLYGYAFLTLLWSPDLDAALTQWQLQIPYVLMICVAAPMLLINTEEANRAFTWTLLVGSLICLLALFLGKWGHRGLIVNGDFLKNETNPLAIASLGGTVTIIAVISVMNTTSMWKKLALLTLALLGMAVILRSGSRGQLVAAVIATIIGLAAASKQRKNVKSWFFMLLVSAILLKGGFLIWDQLGVDSARWTDDNSTADAEGRLNQAYVLLSIAAKQPFTLLFGLGNSSSFHFIGFYPHVAPIEILAEQGIVGLAIYISIIFIAIKSALKLISNDRFFENRGRNASAILISLFIFEWLLTFKQGSLLSSVYVFAYATLICRLTATKESEVDAVSQSSHQNGPLLNNLMS